MAKVLALISAVVLGFVGSAAQAQPPAGAEVNGFGGFFFRAQDPKALAAWYEDNLGIGPAPKSYDAEPWRQEAGPTVFDPFAAATWPFGDEKSFMLNFRTRDLNGLVAHLQSNGNEVELDPQTYPNGRFASTQDPEGNLIQLWEPATPE